MTARKCLPGVAWAAVAVVAVTAGTFLPGVEAWAAERTVRAHGERGTAAARRTERQAARKAANRRPATPEEREAPPAKKTPSAAAKDDDASWVSIYPTDEQ